MGKIKTRGLFDNELDALQEVLEYIQEEKKRNNVSEDDGVFISSEVLLYFLDSREWEHQDEPGWRDWVMVALLMVTGWWLVSELITFSVKRYCTP
jgi:hypothetical protein